MEVTIELICGSCENYFDENEGKSYYTADADSITGYRVKEISDEIIPLDVTKHMAYEDHEAGLLENLGFCRDCECCGTIYNPEITLDCIEDFDINKLEFMTFDCCSGWINVGAVCYDGEYKETWVEGELE
ncbi:MAG: hypothetical protein MJZ35_06995 [Bacteroidaceae bacterium]|nr:hypothetical protein [Bacteroidaceae bacterium]